MASIINYVLSASGPLSAKPLNRVDSLVLSWFAYLRFPEDVDVRSAEGTSLRELNDPRIRSRMVAPLHDSTSSSMLVQAVAASKRFADVRACLHVDDSDPVAGRQFSATTFLIPDGQGAFVAFRGTDDSMLGWKENLHLACEEPVPSQLRALRYLEDVAERLAGPLWVGGHSKGGCLATFACGMASDSIRSRIARCYSHDGPGMAKAVVVDPGWHGDVPSDKTVPRESVVGMLWERSQDGLAIVRSTGSGFMQHDPFTWEVRGDDFVLERGMDYDAWRLSQRLNDWLEDLGESERSDLVELLAWLVDATGESSFSGLLHRWQSNAQAMRKALEAAPVGDRELFSRAMDDLVATVALGSAREHAVAEAGTPEAASHAARRMEDLSARVNDKLARIDRYAGL